MINSNNNITSTSTQVGAMIWIKFLQTIRDKKFLITGLLIPFIVIAISIILNHALKFTSPPNSSTIESTLAYGSSIALIPTNLNQKNVSLILDELKSIYDLTYIEFDDSTLLDNAILNQTTNVNLGIQFEQSSLSLSNFNPTIYYNQSSQLPQLTKSLFVALYKILTNGQELNINEMSYVISSIESFDLFPKIAPILIQYGYIFILPYFSILLVVDRDKGIKNHLYLNSLRNSVYWGSQFFADYLIYLIPAIIGWAALSISKVDGIYNSGYSILLFLTFGLSAIPFGFILQFIFSKEETANKWLYPLISLVSSIPSVLSSFIPGPQGISFQAQAPLSILPSYSLYSGLYLLIQNRGDEAKYIILIQILSGLIFMGIVYLIERYNKPSTNKIDDIENRKQALSGDQDVITERNKILSGQLSKDNQYILIDGIFKQFIQDIPVSLGEDKKKSIKNAVDGIYLGVEKGETFGLLGCNGAGKTTLLNIMTGILTADEGEGYIRGHSISKDPRNAFSSVSSCPQFDILFDNLTVSEHLRFFAWIKGVPSEKRSSSVEFFVNKFNIQEHKDKKAKDLSGGTKRKLSVACSLIGGSSIIFMDEPSSNMDPVGRRDLWSLISELKTGKAIILTTHSIEEADFLCNRVAIMVNGKLRCLGTPLHLKHKYGSGYQLDIVPVDYSIHRPQIENFIRETYPLAKPIERIGTTISFEVPTEQITLSHIFKQIELKKLEIGIKDFSLSQSSLEKVFLKLANEQTSNDEQDPNIKIQNRFSIFNLFKK